MPTYYTVQEGDCIASIAFAHDFFPDTIWNADENSELRAVRPSGNVLLPGDVVVIPDKTAKAVGCATGQRHVFRRKGVPEQFRLRLLDEGTPRAGVEYVFAVDGHELAGKTDDDGKIEQWIPPGAQEATLVVDGEEYAFQLGRLAPAVDDGGVIARLTNLGYLAIDEPSPEELQTAVRAFQRAAALEVTGVVDDATRQALLTAHGC
ncbi:MAG TPA: peptidoglycan-binding domain-containing protein [Thermoanaerobaculia bacterium]|jgi:hypothetical protein